MATDPGAPSWFSICITTEFICAFETCIRFVAFFERTTSLQRVFALDMSPRFTACLMDALTFCSSRWIPAAGADGTERAPRVASHGLAPKALHGLRLTPDLPVHHSLLVPHLLLPLLHLLLRVGRLAEHGVEGRHPETSRRLLSRVAEAAARCEALAC